MSTHAVSYDDLMAFAMGELSGRPATEIATHIAGCAGCAATVRRATLVQATVRADALFSPSPAALAKVNALISGRKPAAVPQDSMLRRMVAALSFDSRNQAALAGLRGGSDAFTLAYEIDDTVIDMHFEPDASGANAPWQLTGQIDDPSSSGSTVTAIAGDGAVRQSAGTDEHGVFLLTLATGDYTIEVETADGLVVLQDIRIP